MLIHGSAVDTELMITRDFGLCKGVNAVAYDVGLGMGLQQTYKRGYGRGVRRNIAVN